MKANQPLRDPLGIDRRRLRSQTELEEPISAELFSVERLEQHAHTLASAQAITDAPRRGRDVQARIADNGRILVESYRLLAGATREERSITPAAEWLVDNFPIVDEQLREIRDDLPPNYYRELPKLAEGPLAGYPRVLGLAWAYIAHTDSRFDPESLRRMVRAYQEVEPLTIGELWAISDHAANPARREPSPTCRSRWCVGVPHAKWPTSSPTASWVSATTAPTTLQHSNAGWRRHRCRRQGESSSSNAFAIRTRRSRRRCGGWRRWSPSREPPPRRWCASNTSARRP